MSETIDKATVRPSQIIYKVGDTVLIDWDMDWKYIQVQTVKSASEKQIRTVEGLILKKTEKGYWRNKTKGAWAVYTCSCHKCHSVIKRKEEPLCKDCNEFIDRET